MTEDEWKSRRVLPYLRGRGGEWIAIPRSRFGREGIPDIVGCYRGRFVAIELKMPGGKWGVTPTQAAFLRRVSAAGGGAICTDSLESIEALLNAIDEEETACP